MGHPDSRALRERRVMTAGALVVVGALVLTYGALPFARQWSRREASIDAAASRVQYLEQLVSRTDALESTASAAERSLSLSIRRVLHARSSTLAASAVQTLLQEAADASGLVVTRLDVSPDDSLAIPDDAPLAATVTDGATTGDLTGGLTGAASEAARTPAVNAVSIPATLSAYGDITGVTHLLGVLATGPRVVHVDRVALVRNSALLGAADVVQVTMTVRVPVVPQ